MAIERRPFQRTHAARVKAKAELDVENMLKSQAHLLLDRTMEPNIKGIMADVVAGRRVSLTMSFVNPDGTPWQPPAPEPEEPAAAPTPPVPPTRSDRVRGFFRLFGRR